MSDSTSAGRLALTSALPTLRATLKTKLGPLAEYRAAENVTLRQLPLLARHRGAMMGQEEDEFFAKDDAIYENQPKDRRNPPARSGR